MKGKTMASLVVQTEPTIKKQYYHVQRRKPFLVHAIKKKNFSETETRTGSNSRAFLIIFRPSSVSV